MSVVNIADVAELRTALSELELLIKVTSDRCLAQGIAPYEAVDQLGRPVLADMLVARVNALAVLAHG